MFGLLQTATDFREASFKLLRGVGVVAANLCAYRVKDRVAHARLECRDLVGECVEIAHGAMVTTSSCSSA